MWFMVGIQLFIIGIFLLLGWGIVWKKAYWLLSNFNGRTSDEKQQLIEIGYPQRAGKLFLATAGGILLLLPLTFTSFKFSMEIQFGFMLFFLLGGIVYLSKYEIPAKRKRSYLISSAIASGTIIFTGLLFYLGYQDFELSTRQDTFEISGVYGDEWHYSDIKKVELMTEMPKVTMRTNGFGMATIAKGKFKVQDYGSSLLFIHKNASPYLYIQLKEEKIFINSKNPKQTNEWFEALSQKAN
jgi:hypothetical protein